MGDKMEFPDTWEEYAEDYGFFDNQGVYTNGSLLIPEFRVRQWLEHKAGWIRTKEQMPKPNQYNGGVAVHYLVETEYSDMYVATWDGKSWKHTCRPMEEVEEKVVAWMPLPEKYLGEEVL